MIYIRNKTLGGIIMVTSMIYGAAVGHADVALSLTSPGVDIENLKVGVPSTICVELTGLEQSQELMTLAATVIFDGVLLGEPVVSAGPIVPDLQDFFPDEDPGTADASFMTTNVESSAHITSEGTFFSFDVTPLTTGSGSFTFLFTDAMLFDPDNPQTPILLTPQEGPGLDFMVVVPEPTMIVQILMLAAGLIASWLVKRLRC